MTFGKGAWYTQFASQVQWQKKENQLTTKQIVIYISRISSNQLPFCWLCVEIFIQVPGQEIKKSTLQAWTGSSLQSNAKMHFINHTWRDLRMKPTTAILFLRILIAVRKYNHKCLNLPTWPKAFDKTFCHLHGAHPQKTTCYEAHPIVWDCHLLERNGVLSSLKLPKLKKKKEALQLMPRTK